MCTALVLIDIQNDYFQNGKMELHESLAATENARAVLNRFRAKNQDIFHIQHVSLDPKVGFFLPETNGVHIHKSVFPLNSEAIIIKHTPNSFLGTDLFSRLTKKGINKLVICGMMTHMCIDSTVRAGREHGFEIILIEDACATRDLVYKNEIIPAKQVHQSFIAALNGKFATVVSTVQFLTSYSSM
ncbi:cysteine hydrolase family protein [Bacillus marasmi]|uniref:cysteine hydrolase family protein n=1 Tax=Bacillus marasmi TaxID=1926279 RepID=UPI0011CAAF15|nr:cysteine hydrolase family protein [Bacillus marasmi]